MKHNVLAFVGLPALVVALLAGCSTPPVITPVSPPASSPSSTALPKQAPAPASDTATGPRLSVTVATGCPASDKDPVTGQVYVGVTNPPPAWSGTFLPNLSPTGALICQYDGLNGKPFSLQSHAHMDLADATKLATTMNQAPLTCPFCDGTYSCPMDDDSITIVVFTYAERPDVAIWMKANGCRTMTNGTIVINSIDSL